MVGTNRSRGCKTCIRRKVRCGAERPTCLRCIAARIPCEGYNRDLRWIEDKHSALKRDSRSASSSSSASSRPAQRVLVSPQTEINIEYFKYKFLRGDADRGFDSLSKWMTICLSHSPEDESYLALNALMSLFFARMHGNTEFLLAQANSYYGKALRQLQASIESLDTSRPTITPAALALTYFEIVAYNSEGGWLHHAGGIGKMMELLGPHRFQDYPEHSYFLLARPLIMTAAMTLRQPTFLADTSWLTVPWYKHPGTKTPSHQIMDFSVQGPSLAREIMRVFQAPDTAPSVIIRMTSMIQASVRWRWDWEKNNAHAVTERAIDLHNTISLDRFGRPLFDTIFEYENTHQMTEIMYYNTALMTLTYCAACLHRPNLVLEVINMMPGSNEQKVTNALGFPGYGIPQTYGSSDLCRSVEYAMRETCGCVDALSLLLPFRMCIMTFAFEDANEGLRSWIAVMCDRVASNTGVALARRLKYLPRIHPSQNIEDEPSEARKLNIAHHTLPDGPVERNLRPDIEPTTAILEGPRKPAPRRILTMDEMVDNYRKVHAL